MQAMTIIKSSVVRPQKEPLWEELFPKATRARTPRIWRMAHGAVSKILKDNVPFPKSLITATALGALDETKNYLDGIFKDGFGSPRNFIASVHNSMAGKIAIDFKIPGPNLTICDGQNSFASAIITASILSKKDFPALLVVIDEKTELLDTVIPYLSGTCKKHLNPAWEEAAVAFLLDLHPERKKPYLSAAGPELIADNTMEEKCLELAKASVCKEITMLPFDETFDSFLKPAIKTYEIVNNSLEGNYAVCSFSPSAQAAAVVTICK